MAGDFTHLHLHTQYSMLDGAIRLKDLFKKTAALGMKSVAVTDHGNMFGTINFYKEAREKGVRPLLGCEVYVAAGDHTDKTNRRTFHLVLLAKDLEGYHNLTYLVSKGHLEGFYYHPRIDKRLLREHAGGLIGLSACLGGEVAQAITKESGARAREVAREYASIFAPGQFFLEVQSNGLPEQAVVNEEIRRMAPELGLPVVATNDCHYVERSDAKAHDILLCIGQGKTVADEKRLKHDVDAFYIKSQAEMEAAFGDWPEVLENTARIAAMCDVELKLGKPELPRYPVPEGHDADSYVDEVARRGLEKRFAEKQARGESFDPDEYRARLDLELGVIKKMGFSGYFLIVWDFINWSKDHGIPVGPGRGSGAGSVAAWALRITDIDPIPFKLLFERFLNPERVSMPDFDVDFCMNRREEVIKYVSGKYGVDRVGQIATFHQLKARGVIRDISRVMGLAVADADRIAKLVPDPVAGKGPTIEEAIAAEPRLKELYDGDDKVREILDIGKALEGLDRHAGMHAAGVVIGDRPLWEKVPCFRGQNDEMVTQYAKDEVEAAGLVKFDFLGLKTLTVIATAVRLVNARRQGEPFDISRIPMDDAEVYKLITDGGTCGVFQLESSGIREMLKKLKPDNIEDVVAAVALYRPGPLEGGMVDDFIDRKHGRKKVVYAHPSLEPILKDTYGVIVYQEQVMQIAQVLAGYSLGRADLLRRAMGKKKAEVMAKEKAGFVEGAKQKGVSEKTADEVFELMAFFAGYGFNRSHSAAYALLTYQTAYLKLHYPHEFVAGLLSCDRDNADNVVKFIAEARDMGLVVERPDVNESDIDFAVVERPGGKVIRFGLGALKGVGESAAQAVLAARAEGGAFTSLFDFCARVDSGRVNRRVVEVLVKGGAFDGCRGERSRAALLGALDAAMEQGAQAQRDKRSGQTSLFGLLAAAPAAGGKATPPAERYPAVEEWAPKQLLAFEKESLGFYITGHPLDRYAADLKRFATATTATLEAHISQREWGKKDDDKDKISVGGIVAEYRERPTKSGTGRMAFFRLEDPVGRVEVIVFPKTYDRVREVLTLDEPLLCTGRVVDKSGENDESRVLELQLDDAVPLSRLRQEKTSRVEITLDADGVPAEKIADLRALLAEHRGSCAVTVRVRAGRAEAVIPLGESYAVNPSDELLLRLERLVGGGVALR